jgi:hypothetical protein
MTPRLVFEQKESVRPPPGRDLGFVTALVLLGWSDGFWWHRGLDSTC